jgi:hypothetical protein
VPADLTQTGVSYHVLVDPKIGKIVKAWTATSHAPPPRCFPIKLKMFATAAELKFGFLPSLNFNAKKEKRVKFLALVNLLPEVS